MKRFLIGVVLACAMLSCAVSFASTCSVVPFPGYNGYCIDGLTPGSYPYFLTSVNITYTSDGKKGTLSASYSGGTSQLLKYGGDYVDIADTLFNFSFDFKNTAKKKQPANWVPDKGSMSIDGTVSSLGITKSTELMSAELTGVWGQATGGVNGYLVGFNTDKIKCDQAIDAYVGRCTTSEVVYFDLLNPIDLNLTSITTSGIALTSVPLPASIWLFGSGLLGLAGLARRQKSN